jgi:hypothetical protein
MKAKAGLWNDPHPVQPQDCQAQHELAPAV